MKQLLIILRDYIKTEEDFTGMCITTTMMAMHGKINYSQMNRIDNYLTNHSPKMFPETFGYWWKKGEKKPRIEFLNNLIDTL